MRNDVCNKYVEEIKLEKGIGGFVINLFRKYWFREKNIGEI